MLRADQVSLDCGSRANPEDGGRTLLIDGFGISGNFANGDCAGNGARFFVDGQPQALAPESTCTVNITRRTARGLAGNIQATLVGGDGTPRPFAVDFVHNDNVLRPIAAINTGTDLCASNTITHTVEEVGGEIIDVFVSDVLGCQANPNATLPPFELRWRRTPEGQIPERLTCGLDAAINLRVGATNTEFGPPGCRSAFRVSETDDRRTLVLYEATLCDSEVSCANPIPNLYLQYDLRTGR